MANLFEKYTATGQSAIIADTSADILNLIAGNGVAITTDSLLKKIRFDAVNGPQKLIKTHPAVITTSAFTLSAASVWTDWPGMGITITPASINSKFAFYLSSEVSWSAWNSYAYVSLFANGVNITQGDVAGPATRCWCDASCGNAPPNNGGQVYNTKPVMGAFVYAPATTSPITFQLKTILTLNGPVIFGRQWNQTDQNRSTIPSTLIIEEIL